jgi:hypothetical protein
MDRELGANRIELEQLRMVNQQQRREAMRHHK